MKGVFSVSRREGYGMAHSEVSIGMIVLSMSEEADVRRMHKSRVVRRGKKECVRPSNWGCSLCRRARTRISDQE